MPTSSDMPTVARRNNAKDRAKHGCDVRIAKTPMMVVFQLTLDNGRVASGSLNNDKGLALLYDGKNQVCKIEFYDHYKGRNWSFPIVRRALNGIISKAGKAIRLRANKKGGEE